MNTRIASAVIWFFCAAYAGSILHGVAGLHEAVGPVLGLATAALIIADPVRRLSSQRLTMSVARDQLPRQEAFPTGVSVAPR